MLTGVASHRIYTLENRQNQQNAHVDAESSPLLTGAADDPDKVFINSLDKDLETVVSFYQLKESEIYAELEHLLKDEENYEEEQEVFEHEQENLPTGKRTRSASVFKNIGFTRPRRTSTLSRGSDLQEEDEGDSDDDDVQETSRLRRKSLDGRRQLQKRSTHEDDDDERAGSLDFFSSRRRTSVAFDDYNDMSFSALYDEGVSLKKRTISLYVSLCELRSFIQLNKTGFQKVLKKYDKIMDRNLKSSYLNKHVYSAYPFAQSTMDKLSNNLLRVEILYSRICTKGDVAEAKRELRLHLREHVVWERNTVWREMIGIERKAQAANLGISQTLLGPDSDGRKTRLQGDEADGGLKELDTPIGKYRCPRWLISKPFWILVFIIAIFAVLLTVPIMEEPEQQNCLAMVIFVSLLWATEVCALILAPKLCLHTVGNTSLRHIFARPISSSHASRRSQ
jgi:hypothetical protein